MVNVHGPIPTPPRAGPIYGALARRGAGRITALQHHCDQSDQAVVLDDQGVSRKEDSRELALVDEVVGRPCPN